MGVELTGWKCPNCGRILSPYISSCDYCAPSREITSSGYVEDNCYIKEYYGALPQKEEIVVETKPNIDLAEVIQPIVKKIINLRQDLPLNADKSLQDRHEGYNLAIDNILELIDEETSDKTVVIEITNPFCKGNCETCTMNCKRRG